MSWGSILKALAKAALAAQTPPPAPPPAPPKARATIAFLMLDANNAPISTAFATFEDGTSKQANDDGYISVEREVGTYLVTFDADDCLSVTRRFQLEANRQFPVRMVSTKPAPVPVPPPVVTAPPVVVTPPVVVPPVAAAPVTDDEFHAAWLAILKKHGNPHAVNLQTLNDTKADVEAIGCEWQHTSDGTLRPRLFLPVAPGADIYSRPFDMGQYGEPWQWIKR